MKRELADITIIKSGVYAQPSSDGNVIYLQAKDLDNNGSINNLLKYNLELTSNLSKHLLNPAHILFMAKGTNNLSTLVDPKIIPKAIPSTAYLIICIRTGFADRILPAYIAWHINQHSSQQYLKAQAKGTSPPSITIPVLGELEINIPDMATQKNILHVHQLRMREKKIKSDIENLKDLILRHQLTKATQQ